MSILFTLIWFAAFILVIVFANNQNRNVFIWGLVALVFSPLLALLGLWLFGKNYG
ncbi:hypothetical protein XbC2_74 [Xanthomonas phage XbC2]|nr:hypothetical protein XbC2_74 [Xanthomonas phage XbC2]